MLFFAEGSSHGRAAYVVKGKGYIVQITPAFSPIAELRAIAMVFHLFQNNLFNLYTDSDYIFKAIQGLETVPYIKMSNDQVRFLFQ